MARGSYVHWHGAACSLMQREQSLSFDVRGLVLTANATRLQKQVAWFFATKASLSSFPGAAENGGDSNHEVENSDAVANSLLSIFNKGGLAKYFVLRTFTAPLTREWIRMC